MEIRPIFSALMRNKPGMILIVLQVAITLAVVCNSLFIILERVERVGRPSGMNEVDTFSINSLGFTSNFDVRATIREDLDLLRSIPGVEAVTTVNSLPMSGGGWSTGFDTQPLDKTGTRRAQSSALYFVDEGGLDAFGAKLIEGRNFRPEEITEITEDSGTPAKSIIVSKALADALFPDGGAVGKQVFGLDGDDKAVTIIGVMERLQQPWSRARFVEQSSLVPAYNISGPFSTYLIRTEPGQRDALMATVEAKLQESNNARMLRDLESVASVRTKSYQFDNAMMTILTVVMGGMVAITGLGIVGLASFWVTRRIKQIGTRRALGARRFNILRYFQTENGIMVTMGVVFGALLTYGFNIWLMNEYDAERLPWFYLPIGALTVIVLGQLAVFGPATRASRVSPAVATRSA
jgi:putative ABC transport system permease protein